MGLRTEDPLIKRKPTLKKKKFGEQFEAARKKGELGEFLAEELDKELVKDSPVVFDVGEVAKDIVTTTVEGVAEGTADLAGAPVKVVTDTPVEIDFEKFG